MRPDGSVDVVDTNCDAQAHPLAPAIAEISAAIKLGVMPCAGGFMDQPARVLAAVRLWDSACRATEERINKKRGAE